MSRAFKKESDDGGWEDPELAPREVLSPGLQNYITPEGAARFLENLQSLILEREPLLEAIRTFRDPEARRKLRTLDQRIRHLQGRRDSFHIIDPSTSSGDRVVFGSRVVVRDEEGREQQYHICGVDEASPTEGRISWISPIARALLSREAGDEVKLRLPRGEVRLEILAIDPDSSS